MNVLSAVREEAAKTYSGADLDAFMAGFEKEAAFGLGVPAFVTDPKFLEAAYKSGLGLAAGLAAVGITKAFTSSSAAITRNGLKSKFESALQFVKNNNKIVKNANQFKVESYAKTLYSFAPHVASDPNILSSLLANAVLGEGIDPMTVKSITDLEGRYQETNAPSSLMGFRT
jgi:hypothetical protein